MTNTSLNEGELKDVQQHSHGDQLDRLLYGHGLVRLCCLLSGEALMFTDFNDWDDEVDPSYLYEAGSPLIPTYDRMLSVDDGNTDVVLEQVVPIRSFYQEACDTVVVPEEMELEKSEFNVTHLSNETFDEVLTWLGRFTTTLAFHPTLVERDNQILLVF